MHGAPTARPCPGPESMVWPLETQTAVHPKAPPSSKHPALSWLPSGSPAPCLRHLVFLVFFISTRLRSPVLPDASAGSRFLEWAGLALGLELPLAGREGYLLLGSRQ